MLFGEKLITLRKERGIKQKEFCQAIGASVRTVRGWEQEGRYPKSHDMYAKIAEVLGCDENYLLTEGEEFTARVTEQYGECSAAQAREVMEQAKALFAGDTLSDADRLAFLQDIQRLFLESKQEAHDKFTPKKYKK